MGDAPGHQEPSRVPRRLTRSFLILHGLEGSGPNHWQTWLAGRLTELGETVRYPELPDPFDPIPELWMETLYPELAALEGERIVICHSLACLLWLTHARDGAAEAAERVLLVAPPCTDDVEAVVRFQPEGVNAEDVRRAANETLMLCSDQDPYCPGGAVRKFADPLGILFEVIPGGGHLNTEAGYGPWPKVEEWALAH